MNHMSPNLSAQLSTPYFVLSYAAQNKIRLPNLNELLHALGNHHRRILFELLCYREAQVVDLVRITGTPYQAIRKQLTVLETSGLIISFKDRNCRFFHAAPHALIMLQIWTQVMARVIDKLN